MFNIATKFIEGVALANRKGLSSYSDIAVPCASANIDKQNLLKFPVTPLTFAKALSNTRLRFVAFDEQGRTVVLHGFSQARGSSTDPLDDIFVVSDTIGSLALGKVDSAALSKFVLTVQMATPGGSAFQTYNANLDLVLKHDGSPVSLAEMKIPADNAHCPIVFGLLPLALPLAPGEFFPEGILITEFLPDDTDEETIDPVAREWFQAVTYTYALNTVPLNSARNGTLISPTTFTNQGRSEHDELSDDDKQALIDNGNMYHTFYGAVDESKLATDFCITVEMLSPNAPQARSVSDAVKQASYDKLSQWLASPDAAEPRAAPPAAPVRAADTDREPFEANPAPRAEGSIPSAYAEAMRNWRAFGAGLAADGNSIVPGKLSTELLGSLNSNGYHTLANSIHRLSLTRSHVAIAHDFRDDHMTRPLHIAMANFRFVRSDLKNEELLDNKISVFNFVSPDIHDSAFKAYRAAQTANNEDDIYEPDTKKHGKKARGIYRDAKCESWTSFVTTLQNIMFVLFIIPFSNPEQSVIYQQLNKVYEIARSPPHRTWFVANERSLPWVYHAILCDIQGRLNLWIATILGTGEIQNAIAEGCPIPNVAPMQTILEAFKKLIGRISSLPTDCLPGEYAKPNDCASQFTYGKAMMDAYTFKVLGVHVASPPGNKRPTATNDKPARDKRAKPDDLSPKEVAKRKAYGILSFSGSGFLPRCPDALDKSNGKQTCSRYIYLDRHCPYSHKACPHYHPPTWDKLSASDKAKLTAFVNAQPNVTFAPAVNPTRGE